jgi:hypothetical protein
MNLTPPQRKQIFSAIHEAYNESDLRRMLLLEFGYRLEDLVPSGLDFPSKLIELIVKAEKSDWLPKLLQGVSEQTENEALKLKIKEFLTNFSVEEDQGANFDPYQSCFLRKGGKFPFMDRQDVRAYIKEMVDQEGAYRTLLIDGKEKSGKTYTNQYISYLSLKLQLYKFAYIDLANEYSSDYLPSDLIRSISILMDMDPNSIPLQEASVDRWNQLLSQWLISQANKAPYNWWIVIDGLSKITLRKDMEGLINRILREIEMNNPKLRVVLLDCGGINKLPIDIAYNVAHTQLEPLTSKEVKAFMQALAAQNKIQCTDAELDLAVNELMQSTASVDPQQYMPTLARSFGQWYARQQLLSSQTD